MTLGVLSEQASRTGHRGRRVLLRASAVPGLALGPGAHLPQRLGWEELAECPRHSWPQVQRQKGSRASGDTTEGGRVLEAKLAGLSGQRLSHLSVQGRVCLLSPLGPLGGCSLSRHLLRVLVPGLLGPADPQVES